MSMNKDVYYYFYQTLLILDDFEQKCHGELELYEKRLFNELCFLYKDYLKQEIICDNNQFCKVLKECGCNRLRLKYLDYYNEWKKRAGLDTED